MKVSVIIPAYNAAPFLIRAVESALQHLEVKEVILVEDGSKDNTLEVCQRLSEQHTAVKLLRHHKGQNKGAGASRNLGINNATQEFIAFLDADDYFTKIRFQKEKEVFKNYPDADGVYGAIGVEYLDTVGAKAWEAKGLDQKSLTTVNKRIDPDHLFEFIIGINNRENYNGYFSIDGLTIKRKSLLEAKVLFDHSLRLHQDTVFLWQASYYLKLYTGEFENAVAIRGVHDNNRFIHENKLDKSRSAQYLVIRDWAIQQKLDEKIINRFHQKFFKHYITSKSKLEKPFSYLKLLVIDNGTRNNFSKKQLKFIWKQMFSKP